MVVASITMPINGSWMLKTMNGTASAISNVADRPGTSPAAAAIRTAAKNASQ